MLPGEFQNLTKKRPEALKKRTSGFLLQKQVLPFPMGNPYFQNRKAIYGIVQKSV